MSVIFKEKNYDQFLIIVNNLLIIVLIMVILLTAINFIIRDRVENLKNNLKLLQEEALKYNSLLRALAGRQNGGQKDKEIKNNNYNNLISLADYADGIIYNSLHFKNSKINLKAVSSQQNNIFTLIEALESDNKFIQVDLININQKENYYFELETIIRQ